MLNSENRWPIVNPPSYRASSLEQPFFDYTKYRISENACNSRDWLKTRRSIILSSSINSVHIRK